MATYQMLWDCSQCDTKGLLGVDHRFCPTCGAPQDPEARYFPSDDQKVAVEDHVFVGADRRCPSCDTANAAIAKHCVACGSPLDKAAEVRKRDTRDAAQQDSAKEARAEHREDKQQQEKARVNAASATVAGATAKRAALLGCLPAGALPIALAALLAVVLLVCCGLFFWSTPTQVTATAHRWQRSIDIEDLRAVSESAWDNSVPAGARSVSCQQKQRDTKQIPDGQDCKTVREDNGDGTFSEKQKCTTRYRTEPVYDDWCTFTVDRWIVARTERSSGGLSDPPRWPDASPRGGERLGSRTESYEVSFKDAEGHTDWCAFPEAKWKTIAVGSRFDGSRSVMGSLNCGSLSGAK